jgi:endonuclease/exonuclease/phosphatase family metal-dependent hydrolase
MRWLFPLVFATACVSPPPSSPERPEPSDPVVPDVPADPDPDPDPVPDPDPDPVTDPDPDPTPDPDPDPAPTPDPVILRVATVNLLSGVSGADPNERLAHVESVLSDLDVDIVSLQEVTDGPLQGNMAENLADALGFHWTWEPTHDVASVSPEGPAVLSRWPILDEDREVLPHGDLAGFTDRAAVGVTVETDAGAVAFVATHLTVSSVASQKADQAKAAHDFALAFGDGARAVILGGDMNAEPDSTAMSFVRGAAEHDGATGALDDLWLVGGDGDGFTFPSDAPARRIDYLYADPGYAEAACWPILDEPADGRFASDHLGLVCDLTL